MAESSEQRTRPQVVAHRGSSEEHAEHTLRAYRRALDAGVDGLECDVRLTSDGHLVCVHDRRIDRTSSGRGLVSTSPLADLEREDFGSWKQPWADMDDELEEDPADHVLTLDALFALVRDWDRPVQLAVETKHPTRYAGLVERQLVDLLRQYGWAHKVEDEGGQRVRVMSFSRVSLRRVHDLAPAVPTVFLIDRVRRRYRDGLLPRGNVIAGPSIDMVRRFPRYVAKAQAKGHAVHVWVVNDQADLELCKGLGVDVVITDRPEHALQLFGDQDDTDT